MVGIIRQASRLLGQPLARENDTDYYEVKVSASGELVVTDSERENNITVAMNVTGVVANTGYVLIDLSDGGGYGSTGHFQHSLTGRIDISLIKLEIDKSSSATGNVKIGVVTSINATDAAVTWFLSSNFANADPNKITIFEPFTPSQVKCGAVGGVMQRIVSNDKDTANTLFQNDTALGSPLGLATVIPGIGDIVLQITRTAGTIGISTKIIYHSEESATLDGA